MDLNHTIDVASQREKIADAAIRYVESRNELSVDSGLERRKHFYQLRLLVDSLPRRVVAPIVKSRGMMRTCSPQPST